jgi:2-(1,2-epoxy-1,2-dihydrophenyl)acetyl-CoA isomerase
MPSGSPPLEEVTARHVRVLRLNRPERKNALSTELGWALIDAVRRAEADDDVRIIALTGNGDAFCSGLDLAPVEGAEVDSGLSAQQHVLDDYGWVGRFLLTFRLEATKPIVAGINGVAVGAGLSLAMCADIRIASDASRLHPGYLRAGTSPDGGLTWTLPTLVGHETAMRFLLESRFIDAHEAHARGLVGEVVAAASLDERLSDYCAGLAQQAPLGVRQTKRLVARALLTTDLEARVREEVSLARRGLDSRDGQEAVRAIMEKRTPSFEGR